MLPVFIIMYLITSDLDTKTQTKPISATNRPEESTMFPL